MLFHTEGEKIIYGFGTENFLEILCKADKIYMDGTFSASPKLFTQLYTIHTHYNGHMIPLIYLLLPDKSSKTYQICFEILCAEAKKRNLTFNPAIVQIDFEQAVIKAINAVFPNTEIKGCLFHFSQAIWRRAKKYGLSGKNYKGQVKKIIRLIMALPFLKLNDVIKVWKNICAKIDKIRILGLSRLKKYCSRTWLSTRSLFPLIMWNQYCSKGDNIRTNNHLEGWHNGLNQHMLQKHPNIYKLINILKNEQSYYNNTVKLIQNNCQPPKQKKKFINRNKLICESIAKYEIGAWSPIKFIETISIIMHD